MTAITTRLLKEARPLFWPWCAVALAGALPLIHPIDWTPLVFLIGFLAVPLLATLSFGDEFQYRTFSLLLSQPAGRMKIWGEKMGITLVAVVSAVLVFSLALRATAFHPGRQELMFAGAWMVAIIASATFWTLFTRSTVGGVAVNIVVQTFIVIIVPWTSLADWLRARGYLSPVNAVAIPTVTLFLYAGVMLWLGWRTLARFQAIAGMAGDDLLMAGPDVMSGAFAQWLRSRPTGAILNLFRKELRLLRPVWLISLLSALGWACLTLYGLLYERRFSRNFETAVVIVGVISTLMIAILAGSMSLGEERASGTHSWHLTLPVPALHQWLIKLFMALFAGLVGAGLLPMLIGSGFLFRATHTLVDVHLGIGWLVAVLLLTFAAFWCACAVEGTVGAVLWVFPVAIALSCAGYFAIPFAGELLKLFYSSRFNPYADFHFAWRVARFLNGPEYDYRIIRWFDLLESPMIYTTLAGGPALLLALVQSYRLFRAPLQNSRRSVARNLVPLVILVFLSGFSLTVLSSFLGRASWQVWGLFGETGWAIEKNVTRAAKLSPAIPLQLTGDDLAKALPYGWPLSISARYWLHNARITVTPDPAHAGGFYCVDDPHWSNFCYYSAIIHMADGTDLTESFEPTTKRNGPFGHRSIRAHWPGTTGEESMGIW